MRGAVLGLVVVVAAGFAAPAGAADYDTLSPFERSAVDEALFAKGLTVERQPEGKRVGRIYVHTQEVFTDEDGFITFLNLFHATTQDDIVAREVLLEPGRRYDPLLVGDTERNLRDPFIRLLVVVIPVQPLDGDAEDVVDLLVVTRDVWSLRANTNFQTTGAALDYLSTSISENNLAGWNKKVAATLLLQRATVELGARYDDPRLAGSRLALSASQGFILNRDDGAFEGLRGDLAFGLPLYSHEREWGFSLLASYSIETFRDFVGTEIRTYDAPETTEVEAIPRVYDWFGAGMEAYGVRSFGHDIKSDVRFGYGVSVAEPEPTESFSGDDDVRRAFVRDVLPREELASYLLLGYDLYFTDYRTLYDVQTFALAEEVRIGPSLSVTARWASRSLFRSDNDFVSLRGAAGWVFMPFESALLWVRAGASTRIQGEPIDNLVSAEVGALSPSLWGAGRLHLLGVGALRFENSSNARFTLGGDTALRGVISRGLIGDSYVRWNAEFRTTSFRLWIWRLGAAVFYDAGDAFDYGEPPRIIHAVGAGARILTLPLNRNVIRLDYGVPLTGPQVGFEAGVFSAGFEQAF